jgi:CheY-like chemotaxis protein
MPKDDIEILLVEDDPEDLDLTLRALREASVCTRIQVARDGEEALDFLFCRGPYSGRDPVCQPKVILLDLKLPKVDGLEVLEQIRSDPHTQAVPVVILTSSKLERDVMRGYRLGVNSFIQKPVDFDRFRTTIQQLGYYWLVVNQPPRESPAHQEVQHAMLSRY